MTGTATSIEDVQEAVRDAPPGVRLLPVAGATKPALSRSRRDDVVALDLSGLSGVLEYDPAELTLTALAGTPVREVQATLAQHGQQLPFDPPLVAAGATLGGVVAAGASGAGAWRHGGVRDFVIGVRFVDGSGHLIAGGGRVVKNAAGFDLPKLMVGSAGRLGVIVQLSFKVFPRQPASTTLELSFGSLDDAVTAAAALARGPVELDALEILPGATLLARVGGRADTLDSRVRRLTDTLDTPARLHEGEQERALWDEASELAWVPADSALVRVGLSIRQLARLDAALAATSGTQVRYGIGGTVAWVAWPAAAALDDLDRVLHDLRLPGMVLLGPPDRRFLGPVTGGAFGARIVKALDPHSRFLEAEAVRHAIPLERYGPQAPGMAEAIESCVHCGFCLPTCPTYVELGEEMDSPRGRILLIKEVLEGELELESALPYIDNCLGCQACETACPSGVRYGELITPFRAHAEQHRERDPIERLQRMLTLQTLPYPRRLRLAARLGRFARPLARALPASAGTMLGLLPDKLPAAQPLPSFHPAQGQRRARVALLAGCAQQVLSPNIGWATLRVLARNGVETVIPDAQGCCGALASHTGAAEQARRLARRNLNAFPRDVDAIVTNAAGCGSGMKEYELLFQGEPEHAQATSFASRVIDVTALLDQLGIAAPPPLEHELRIAYHDACHLAHAQRVREPPRRLLAAIPGVSVITPAEWELCCGSAGTYNIERPRIAAELGERKAHNLIATAAQLITAGNIGCLTQITVHLQRLGHQLPVIHTIEALDAAYAGTLGRR